MVKRMSSHDDVVGQQSIRYTRVRIGRVANASACVRFRWTRLTAQIQTALFLFLREKRGGGENDAAARHSGCCLAVYGNRPLAVNVYLRLCASSLFLSRGLPIVIKTWNTVRTDTKEYLARLIAVTLCDTARDPRHYLLSKKTTILQLGLLHCCRELTFRNTGTHRSGRRDATGCSH
jgi:hypothetical protein